MTQDEIDLRNAVLQLWIKTGEPVTVAMLNVEFADELEGATLSIQEFLDDCGWSIEGLTLEFVRQERGQGNLEAFTPTKELLRQYILQLRNRK